MWDKYVKVVMSKRAIRALDELNDESHISDSAHDHELLKAYEFVNAPVHESFHTHDAT